MLAMSLTRAQQRSPEEIAARTTAELVQKLNLNDEQKTAVSNIILDHSKSEYAILEDSTASESSKAETVSKLQSSTDAKVSELLTDDQKAIFQSSVATRPAKSIPPSSNPLKNEEEH